MRARDQRLTPGTSDPGADADPGTEADHGATPVECDRPPDAQSMSNPRSASGRPAEPAILALAARP